MDVKSACLRPKIEEEVYLEQHKGFEKKTHPEKNSFAN